GRAERGGGAHPPGGRCGRGHALRVGAVVPRAWDRPAAARTYRDRRGGERLTAPGALGAPAGVTLPVHAVVADAVSARLGEVAKPVGILADLDDLQDLPGGDVEHRDAAVVPVR